MKVRVIFCFILLLLFNSCEDESLQRGLVTGVDMRYCACCGGYFIEISNKTYRFNNHELPAGSPDFDLVKTFPVKVFVKWELKEDGCLGDEIKISKIKTLN